MTERMVTNYCERCAELEAERDRLQEQVDDLKVRQAGLLIQYGEQRARADAAEAKVKRLREAIVWALETAVEPYQLLERIHWRRELRDRSGLTDEECRDVAKETPDD